MAGVPRAVQGAFILGSPVLDRPSGRGSSCCGRENHRGGFEDLRESDPALGDVSLGLVVPFRGNFQAIANQVRQRLVQLVSKLLQARLMESSAFVEHFDVVRFVEFFEHRGNVHRLDA